MIIYKENNENESGNDMVLMDYEIDNITYAYYIKITKVYGDEININTGMIDIVTNESIDLPLKSITGNYSLIGSYINEKNISYSILNDGSKGIGINVTSRIKFIDNDGDNKLSKNDEFIITTTNRETGEYYSSSGYAISIMDENYNELIYYFAIPDFE